MFQPPFKLARVGRPLMGLLSDKYGGATVASVGYFIAGIFA